MAQTSDSFPIFFGEFRHTLDQKNRITIPARWRVEESNEYFITHNVKRSCLTAYPTDVFQRVSEDSRALAATPAEHKLFKSLFYSQAQICPIDKQGRMLLPEEFCTRAGLSSELVLAGISDRFEIWNPVAWQARKEADQAAFENLAERMGL